MCRAFEDLRNESLAKGHAEGLIEGTLKTQIAAVHSLMLTLNLTARQAMDALEIPQEEREKILSML